MSAAAKFGADGLIPILCVRNFAEAMDYYVNKLLFRKLWDWDSPPNFGAVGFGKVEIFFCLQGQGNPGTWMSIFMDDVDSYYEAIKSTGAEIITPPTDYPWCMREMHVRDPNQHVIRFGHGIPSREPKLEIERVPVETRLEKRLAGLLADLAREKGMTIGEALEETLLHSFEEVSKGGVASPHTKLTLRNIQELKKKHGIDYETHASYRFNEKSS